MSTVGERIEEQASKAGLNLRKLAIKANVPYNTVYAIVKRKSQNVNPVTIMRIAYALGINPRYLTGENEFPSGLNDYETEGNNSIRYILDNWTNLDPFMQHQWLSDLVQLQQKCEKQRADEIATLIFDCINDKKKADELLLVDKAEPQLKQIVLNLLDYKIPVVAGKKPPQAEQDPSEA